MISRRVQENIAIAVLLVFFVGIIVMSMEFGPRARLVPVPVATFAVILLLFQLVWQNIRPADELNVDLLDVLTDRDRATSDEPPPPRPTAEQEAAKDAAEWRRIGMAFGFVALFAGLSLLIGPMPSLFLFTSAYFIMSGHFRPAKAILYTALFTAAVYVIFVQILRLQLYHGYLEPVAEFLRRTF